MTYPLMWMWNAAGVAIPTVLRRMRIFRSSCNAQTITPTP